MTTKKRHSRKMERPKAIAGLISLMVFIGLMVFTGCAKEHAEEPVPQVEQTPIVFSGLQDEGGDVNPTGARQDKGVTRAEPLHEIATSFRVWGYKNMDYAALTGYGDLQKVIPGYKVNWLSNSAGTTTTNSKGWEYVGQEDIGEDEQSIKYWDLSAAAYKFFGATGYSTHGANGTNYELSIAADASDTDKMDATPYFSHLWFSTGDPVTYPDKQFRKPVTLEFLKPYSRVRFLFIYTYPREGVTLTGVSFKPTNDDDIVRKGIVTVSYPLTGPDTRESFTVTPDGSDAKVLDAFTEDYDPEDDAKVYTKTNEGWYMVLPNSAQDSYTLSVTVNGEGKSAVVPAQYMQWQPGYSYTYVFKILDEGGIEIGWVESAVTPWTDMEAEWTVYNW